MWRSKVHTVSAVGRTKQQEALQLTLVWLTSPPSLPTPGVWQARDRSDRRKDCSYLQLPLEQAFWGYIYMDRRNHHGFLQCCAQVMLKVGQYRGCPWLELACASPAGGASRTNLFMPVHIDRPVHLLAGGQMQSCLVLSLGPGKFQTDLARIAPPRQHCVRRS